MPGAPVGHDSLIATYYQTFHKYHPVVLSRDYLSSACASPAWQGRLAPVVQIMRLIGHIYAHQKWSADIAENVERLVDELTEEVPLLAQASLLFFIALFWQGHQATSRLYVDKAITSVRGHGLYQREFADQHVLDGPIWMESWRRTWLMIYVVDAYYVGTLGTGKLSFSDLTATADLPCEDIEFESGEIPSPKTLFDMQNNKFAEKETIFSAFACLVGAVQCASLAMIASKQTDTNEPSTNIIQRGDTVIDSWMLLVPQSKKPVMLRSGQVDELMFQAHLLIHVASIGLHRTHSDLKFNAIEAHIYLREGPSTGLRQARQFECTHLTSIALSRSTGSNTRVTCKTIQTYALTTCMVNEGVLALLSACNFLFSGKDLEIARAQLRMTMGCLQSLAETWLRIASNLKEIKTIARHVSSLDAPLPTVVAPSSPQLPNVDELLDWYTFEGFDLQVTDDITAMP